MKQIYILSLLYIVMMGCTEDIVPQRDDSAKLQTRAGQADDQVFYYYGYENRKVFLSRVPDKVFVKFAPKATKEQFRALVADNISFKSTKSNPEKYFIEGYSENSIVLEGKSTSSDALNALNAKREVASATYLLEHNGSLSAYTDEFIVKLKEGTSYAELQKLTIQNDVRLGTEDEFVRNQYNLYVSKTSELDAIQAANLFYETGLFEFAEPNLIDFDAGNSYDEFFPYQWGLKNTGQSGGIAGVDINVEQAWKITKGSPSIRIAVIDSGIDLNHPDLKSNLLTGYDATGYGTVGAPYSSQDNHGTSVAGIIGALQNNLVGGSYEGISGIAPNCKIVSVKASIDGSFDRSHSSAAINWVSNNNKAEVINCSFGSQNPPTTNLTNAIANAITKGCVVVCASGNDGLNNVGYPADSNPNIIAVGAIDRTGIRASFSNYGSQLDVVAPGIDIYTTDRQGSVGYASGNYFSSFNGTSAAAPHVSGIAALILSAYPDLTQREVADCITSTASGSGYRNNTTGYGLVNAYQALIAPLNIEGPDFIFKNANVTYTIPNTLPQGVTFNGWSVAYGDYTSTGMNGTTLNIKFLSSHTYTLNANFRLSNNSTFSVQKQIAYIPPAPEVESTGYRDDADDLLIRESDIVTFSVPDPTSGVSYEWRNNGRNAYKYDAELDGRTLDRSTGALNVRYRMIDNGKTSEWSDMASAFYIRDDYGRPLVSSPVTPILYMVEDYGLGEWNVSVENRQKFASYDWNQNSSTYHSTSPTLSTSTTPTTVKCRSYVESSGPSAWSAAISF